MEKVHYYYSNKLKHEYSCMCCPALAGSDYTMLYLAVLFPTGAQDNHTQCVNVSITNDDLLEISETFTVQLTSADQDILTPDSMTDIIITSEDGIDGL